MTEQDVSTVKAPEANYTQEPQNDLDLASLVSRWKAWVFDGFLLLGVVILSISLLGIFSEILGIRKAMGSSFIMPIILGFILVVFYTMYFIVMHGKYGQTLGKMAMGIKVVGYNGEPISYMTSFVRWLGYCLNNIIGIGWFWAIFDPKQRGLHDLISKTIVIKSYDEKQCIKPFVAGIFILSFILMIIAMFITGGIGPIEYRHY